MYYRTTTGGWWSATRSSATNANNLNTNTSNVYPQHSGSRGNGFALRCVANKIGVVLVELDPSVPNYNRINEWPLQFLRTGDYHRSYGQLNGRATDGYWWSSTAGSATGGRRLRTWTGDVLAQDNYFRGYGFALRCGEGPQKVQLTRLYF